MKKSNITKAFIVLMIGLIGYTLYIYFKLPNTVPSHWNVYGEVDGWSHKSIVFVTLLIPVLTYYGMPLLRKIDPKRKNYEKYEETFNIFRIILTVTFMILHLVIIYASQGNEINISLFVPLFIGVMFIVLGNYMARVKQNFFIGIKTPWTLSSETVWNKTHRVGGYVFVLSGILMILASIITGPIMIIVSISIILVGTFGTIVYSYLLYKKENEGKSIE